MLFRQLHVAHAHSQMPGGMGAAGRLSCQPDTMDIWTKLHEVHAAVLHVTSANEE